MIMATPMRSQIATGRAERFVEFMRRKGKSGTGTASKHPAWYGF
jgi:hypothetical protein